MSAASLTIGAALAALMLAIAVSDWRRYRVPDAATAAALVLRGVDLALQEASLGAWEDATARAVVAASMFYLFRAAYRRLRHREGLGLGDVKLAAVAGAWVDWALLPYVVEAAALVGLAIALARARRAGLSATAKLPFAVGFAPAIFIGWSLGRIPL